jgi:hypothetical protein
VSPPLASGLVAPKLACVAGHPLPILSAPDVVQTVAVPPPMVVMVYGKRMELDCATSSGAEVNPAHAKRTVAARTVARTTRIIRPRTFFNLYLKLFKTQPRTRTQLGEIAANSAESLVQSHRHGPQPWSDQYTAKMELD